MQRYRVNYTMLAVLLVGLLVCSGAVYGLWRFQVERKADDMLVEADKAIEEGDYRQAEEYLRNFLQVRPEDREVEIRHANLWADIGENKYKMKTWAAKDYGIARAVMDTTLRRYPDEDKLRRRQVDLTLKAGNSLLKDAIAHIDILLNNNPDDAELKRMRSDCLFRAGDTEKARDYAYKLIGYDPQTDTFDATKAGAPGEEVVYRNVANLLRGSERLPDLADRVMNQLVETNPEKPAAYLQRGEYRLGNDEKDEAKADLHKALELDPKNADALAANAEFQLREMQEDLKERIEDEPQATPSDEAVASCRELLEIGVAEHPTDVRFYQLLARLELARKDYEASMKHVEQGLTQVDENLRIFLLLFQADLQLGEQELIGARKTATQIRDSDFNPKLADYIEARCKLVEERWFEARRMLEEVKPAFEQSPTMLTQINFQLGLCEERLGLFDRAEDYYELALQADPNNAPAAAGIVRAKNARGIKPEDNADESLFRLFTIEQQKPKKEQDWGAFDQKIDEHVRKYKLPESAAVLLKVEFLMQRDEFDAARELLKVAYSDDPYNLSVRRAAMKLVANDPDPDQGPEKAMQLLEAMVSNPKFGDSPQLRLDKADLLIQMSNIGAESQTDTQLEDKLLALTEGISDWTVPQQVQLWSGLASKFFQIRLRDEAETCWKKVAELAPGDLATRVMLFKMSREGNDDAGMKEAQDSILELVGSQENSNWLYTEAHRLLSQVSRGIAGEEAVQQAADLVAKALVERPDWNELFLLQAEIELRRGNESAALQNYDRAMKLGRAAPGNVLQYAQLLVRRGRWVDAREALEMLDTAVRQRVLGQLYAEILLNTGSPEQAVQTADVVIEADPENPAKQLWYGQFVLRTVPADKKFEISAKPIGAPELVANPPAKDEQNQTEDRLTVESPEFSVESSEMTPAERKALTEKLEKSGNALAKTVELAPSSPDSWLPWVGYLVSTKQLDRAAEAIRQAQLALAEDDQPLLLARCYEITGRWFDAENLYRSAVENKPGDVRAKRLLAAFYLGNGYPLEANKQRRATPLINGILKAAAEGNAEPGDENVLWARRTAADMLAATGDYQNLLKAEKLLASNAIGGDLAVEDQLRMAQILAPRPEPISKVKAQELLSDVKRNQRLTPAAELVLGQLYFANEEWENSRQLMTELIARIPRAEAPRVAYMRMLLQRGDASSIREANRQLDRLIEYAPGSANTMELVVLMAIKTGKENEARNALRRLLPAQLDKVDEKNLPVVGRVAELLTQLKDYDEAETLYRFIAGKKPQFIPALASFLGIHRDPDKCFELLEKLQGKLPPSVLIQSALAVLRERRDEFGDKYDPQVQTWLDRALRDDPEAITLLLQQAELSDQQGEYNKAADIYRELLKRQDVEGQSRAIVLNNLAFLLALGGDKEATSGEALELVQEAIYLVGPTGDILDTRAMVLLAQKQYSAAIADLELAVRSSPTPSNLYHLAKAHLAANNTDSAVQAWNKAVAQGLTRDSLNHMEWDQYEKIKEQIENPDARSASL